MNHDFNSIYRGIVVNNFDPKYLGRCKVFVYGVYPEEFKTNPTKLPWAEPVMSIFGGSWTNENKGLNSETGVSSNPHVGKSPGEGAQVWLFFENGSPNHPKYFGVSQAGPGWLAEHNNQHVIKTDNVRIRIDENPSHARSTCHFDSYNADNVERSQKKQIKDMPTRVDVEIWNEGSSALNLIIKGNVNI